ncbi:MAG TPA: hypothetical protein VJK48_02250 [Chlamydiales bacterium]|nr:hypothetical protein [Chlamydiales bacterium]
MGMTYLFPTLGVGLRVGKNGFAFDGSVQFATIGLINLFTTKGMFLYYPKESIFYIGAGPGFWISHLAFNQGSDSCVSAEQVVGIEWEQMFLQVEISEMKGRIDSTVPTVTLGIGF